MSKSSRSNLKIDFGMPIISILAVVFITLKLAEIGVVATWSWWWVLSPLWIPFAILLGIALIALLIAIFLK